MRMMATVHPASTSLLALLESLEDSGAGLAEQTDAYLTIANRLSGEDQRHFLPAVVKHFTRLGKVFQNHISNQNSELSQAALQALGFCVFHSNVVSGIPATFVEELLVSLSSLLLKSPDKNTCTRALWVISKQNFSAEVVARKVPDILKTLEAVQAREDVQSVVMEHEALNVVIRLLEQTPTQMGEGAVQWAKLVIPLVVHSASKVRLRAAAALEMGMPLLLEKQQEVAAIIEPLMSSKLIPELQKLFSSKNETNVLKLWPLFVRLLGKLLHRGGPFINSLLHLEELGFRSSSPVIKKIAFIAWKSLIDNFALNPEILCSAKRLKLLMQPLSSIQVRTEALLLTKLEVWWYLVVKLGPNLAANFEQVGVPLLQSAVCTDSQTRSPPTPARNSGQSTSAPVTPKAGGHSLNNSNATPRMNLNSSMHGQPAFPSIQLLGLEMLLHYFLGSEVIAAAAKHKLQLSLEPLSHPLLTSPSSFSKHSAVLISAARDGFVSIGKDAPEALLTLVWKNLIGFVTAAVETAGNKKERQGTEVLTLLMQALQHLVASEALPAHRILGLLEATVKGIPNKILGSAAYQVANMDVLNGTPALFLILLLYQNNLVQSFVGDERLFLCLETLVTCSLSGPTSPLAFSESVLGVMGRSVGSLENKEHLWRMWSILVNALTDTIMQTNEVNQGDALEHNFTAVHSALMFPVTHLLRGQALPQMTQKSLLGTWSKLYKAFARCSALVATAEENVCCEELCAKMTAALDQQDLSNPSTLDAVAHMLLVIIECVDFSPYAPQFQQKTKSPHTPSSWVRRRTKALGNLTTFLTLLVRVLESFLSQALVDPKPPAEGAGVSMGGLGTILVAVMSLFFNNLALATAVQEMVSSLAGPLALFYEQAGRPQNEELKFYTTLGPKLEKLLGEILACLQARSVLAYDDELLVLLAPLLRVLLPHRSKQIRTLVTQFWNATFANAPVLTYPEELKPILSQVKQRTPIILPGFQSIDAPDEYSGPYSSESSQLETKISGVKVMSGVKRDSLLARAGDQKEKTLSKSTPQAKLDFGSPKPPRREVLEEEASMDFVFIPPETKERVLTEHQKEVKRTKRVDIPAMYNNLDASLDTTLFTQYTQSQDDPANNLPVDENAEGTAIEGVQKEEMEGTQVPEARIKPAQEDLVSSKMDADDEGVGEQKTIAEDAALDISMQEDVVMATRDCSDADVSASSDVVSGTPQKPNSRRQSFITLEKYKEGKPASPVSKSKFTGPLVKTSSSQDPTNSQPNDSAPQVNSEPEEGKEATSLEAGSKNESSINNNKCETAPEKEIISDVMEKMVTEPEVEPLGNYNAEGTEDDEDIILDTQEDSTKAIEKSGLTGAEDSSADSAVNAPPEAKLKDESECTLISPSQSEVRRSGRRRSKPVRPGDDKTEVKDKTASQTDSQSQGRLSRSNMEIEAAQQGDKDKLRRGRSIDVRMSRSVVQKDSSLLESRTRRSKVTTPAKEKESSQADSQEVSASQPNQMGKPRLGRPSKKSKLATEAESKLRSNSCPNLATDTAASQVAEMEEGTESDSQGHGRYRTRRSSQGLGLLPGIDNSESDSSETRDNSQSVRKRGRKRNLLNSEMSQSPKKSPLPPPPPPPPLLPSDLIKKVENDGISKKTEFQNVRQVKEALELSETLKVEVTDIFTKPVDPAVTVKPVLEAIPSQGEGVESAFSEKTESEGKAASAEGGSTELVDVAVKSQLVHVCPHSKRGRGRRRSRICHCFTASAPSQEESISDSQSTQGLGEDSSWHDQVKTPADSSGSLQSQPESTPLTEGSADDGVFLDMNRLCTPPLTDSPSPSKTVAISDMEAVLSSKECEAEIQDTSETVDMTGKDTKEQPADMEDKDKLESTDIPEEEMPSGQREEEEEEEEEKEEEEDMKVQEELHPQNASGGDDIVVVPQEQIEMTIVEEVEDAEMHNDDMPVTAAAAPPPLATLPDEPPVPPQTTSPPLCLDSPPKQKCLDAVVGEEMAQSPSSAKMRGTWSPSASPSTSILKKGQKRPLEEESPSPMLKSRRVSFADPIHHQELADDIDRRSPVIRTSNNNSPRSKGISAISQQKFITTPTKGLVTLSPRNLRSPGYKSSKKCLISEMSQEPKSIPTDCVYPALVGCSAPVEAVLPQLTSNMWPRGFGQLVRARNIKTVGDLCALTPSEIKSLPIRSPKLSNVKKALKTYHEQQRKGRSDELKSFDEMEKMTSEPEEVEMLQSLEQEKMSPPTELAATELPAATSVAEQTPVELLSEVEALGARLTPEELGRCPPGQLVLMHEHLGGMMRTIVAQLRARLTPSPGESIP